MSVNLSIYEVLIRPLVTEKSTSLAKISPKYRKYSFAVHKDANKDLIRTAVQSIFGVEVHKVNIRNTPGKVKFFRQRKGFRAGYKKAEVTVKSAMTGVDYGLGDVYGT